MNRYNIDNKESTICSIHNITMAQNDMKQNSFMINSINMIQNTSITTKQKLAANKYGTYCKFSVIFLLIYE